MQKDASERALAHLLLCANDVESPMFCAPNSVDARDIWHRTRCLTDTHAVVARFRAFRAGSACLGDDARPRGIRYSSTRFNPRHNPIRRGFAAGFAILVAGVNITFPIAVLTGVVG